MNRKFLLGPAAGVAIAFAALYAVDQSGPKTLAVNSDDSSVVAPPASKEASSLQQFIENGIAPPPAPAGVIDEQTVRALVRDEISKNPAIVMDVLRNDTKGVVEALNAYMQKQQEAAQEEMNAKTLKAEPQLTESAGYPAVGNREGKVELFYYFDVNCHYCKQIEPELARFVAANPDVKVVHREMPILAQSSRYAALMAGIVFAKHPDHYQKFHDMLMQKKPGMTEADVDGALVNVVGGDLAGPIIAATRAPGSDPIAKDVANRVAKTMEAADAAGVTGTPFIIVKDSGLVIRGAEPDAFAKLESMAVRARRAHEGEPAK